MTWNQQQEEADAEEKIDRCVKFADHVALVVSERKRALEAWQKAQALQTELDALKAAHAWIKTSERLPADDARVLALVVDGTGTKQIEIVDFLSRGPAFLFADGNETKIVTWWMQLPEPPK
jgi:hypothetical protein